MPKEIVMPLLGSSMEEGYIVEWLKKEGEKVSKGEPLIKVETDKAVLDAECHYNGTIDKIMVQEGETAEVGDAIALLLEEGEKPSDDEPSSKEPAVKEKAEQKTEEPGREDDLSNRSASENVEKDNSNKDSSINKDEKRIFVSPLARKMAAEKGYALEDIKGTGPGGRIVKADILEYSKTAEQKPEGKTGKRIAEEIKISQTRKRIAEKTRSSKQERPHYYVSMKVNVQRLLDIREELKVSGVKVSINDFILKAAALGLDEYPMLNASYREDRGVIEVYQDKNIGMIIGRDEGVIIPVIRNTDSLSLKEIADLTAEYVERIRGGEIDPDILQDGTFTVSNLGMYGVCDFTAVINPPEAAILAVGGIEEELKIKDGEIVEEKYLKLTLSLDHRVVDGVTGALFLKKVKELLETPLGLII